MTGSGNESEISIGNEENNGIVSFNCITILLILSNFQSHDETLESTMEMTISSENTEVVSSDVTTKQSSDVIESDSSPIKRPLEEMETDLNKKLKSTPAELTCVSSRTVNRYIPFIPLFLVAD